MNQYRYFLSISIAVVVASVFSYFYSFSHEFLIPITTLVVMLTPVGNVIYQSALRFMLMLVFVTIFSWFFSSAHALPERFYDVTMGAILGMLANVLIFPRHPDQAFREQIIPIITASKFFLEQITLSVLKTNPYSSSEVFERALIKSPGWVYATGFDMGLKKGHQFFLMKVNHLSDVLFSMHYLSRYRFEEKFIEHMNQPLQHCMHKVLVIFDAIITVMQLKTLTEGIEDFSTELDSLEQAFLQVAPASIELMDFKKDYLYFAEYIQNLKDLRKILLKLIEALR